jgi:hypothetical protein
MYECKNMGAIPWQKLAKDQLWDQANSLIEDYHHGKLWVIGQIGFSICFFRFNLFEYKYSDWFTNFSPLNLHNFSPEQLNYLKIKHITESIDSDTDVVQVIEWRLDNWNHHNYIHEMFQYILNNDP